MTKKQDNDELALLCLNRKRPFFDKNCQNIYLTNPLLNSAMETNFKT